MFVGCKPKQLPLISASLLRLFAMERKHFPRKENAIKLANKLRDRSILASNARQSGGPEMQNRTGHEMPRIVRHPVTIKGVRDGLVFLLDDQYTFNEILEDLQDKLNSEQGHLLLGPIVHVTIQTGSRILTAEQKQSIRDLLSIFGNLIIQDFSSEAEHRNQKPKSLLYRGTVRSGQELIHDGDIVVVGDINPGAQVIATGDIFVMGTLRGIAHAGCEGNEQAIISAVYFQPTQLRIGNVISRSPDPDSQMNIDATEMEFSYLKNGQMAVDKMSNLNSIRPRK
jgi:septum site-determining protein MinC